MLLPRRFTFLVLLLGAVCLPGCHATQAHSAPSASASPKPQVLPAKPPVSKQPPHDSALSTYNNPAYGLSFRYPRTYLLDDPSDSESDSILEAQQDLAVEQPSAVLLATVTIPSDAYPNTTFVRGELQLVVNPTVSPEVCQSFAAPDDETYRSGSTSAQNIIFRWRQTLSATAGPGALHRDYAAFSGNTCYEFFLDVVTTSNPGADPQPPGNANLPIGVSSNPANPPVAPKITHQLEKIISSLQLQNSPRP